MPALKSSNLASADWQDGVLTVTFRSGSTYSYAGVSEPTYNELLEASSPGAYFAANIKNAYPTTRVS